MAMCRCCWHEPGALEQWYCSDYLLNVNSFKVTRWQGKTFQEMRKGTIGITVVKYTDQV